MKKHDFYQARLLALQEKAQRAKEQAQKLALKSDVMCEKLQEVIAEVQKEKAVVHA